LRLRHEPLPVPCQERHDALVEEAYLGPVRGATQTCRAMNDGASEGSGASAKRPRVYLRYLPYHVPPKKRREGYPRG
jgi:hypothetical protein